MNAKKAKEIRWRIRMLYGAQYNNAVYKQHPVDEKTQILEPECGRKLYKRSKKAWKQLTLHRHSR